MRERAPPVAAAAGLHQCRQRAAESAAGPGAVVQFMGAGQRSVLVAAIARGMADPRWSVAMASVGVAKSIAAEAAPTGARPALWGRVRWSAFFRWRLDRPQQRVQPVRAAIRCRAWAARSGSAPFRDAARAVRLSARPGGRQCDAHAALIGSVAGARQQAVGLRLSSGVSVPESSISAWPIRPRCTARVPGPAPGAAPGIADR